MAELRGRRRGGLAMTIDEYLAELERHLPRTRRRRFLAEAEEHLRDAARANRERGLDTKAAEKAAVRSFGGVGVVARRFAAEAAVWETRLAGLAAFAAAGSFVLPLYVVPENTLPPAQWETKPRDILIPQVVTVALWAGAVALAAVSAFLAWTRWTRLTAFALSAAVWAIAGSVLVSAILVLRWFDEVPATASWPLVSAPLAIACLAACAGAAAWARRRRGLLSDDLVQD